MGGTMIVKSRVGFGTTFSFSLPINLVADEMSADAVDQEDLQRSENGAVMPRLAQRSA